MAYAGRRQGLNRSPLLISTTAQTGGSQVGRGIQREGDTLSNRSRSRGILLSLSLTLIKAIAQSVKNDFIPALGQQGLVG